MNVDVDIIGDGDGDGDGDEPNCSDRSIPKCDRARRRRRRQGQWAAQLIPSPSPSTPTSTPTCASPLVLGAVCLALQGACGGPDPMQAHLERELSFFHTGVSIDSERDRVEHALGKAGLRVVSEVRGPSFVALGAADGRFVHTAIRVITKRGVVTGDDASRNDLFHPGRVHLLQDAPVRTGPLSLVAWVRILEGDTAGCAAIFHVDREGFVHLLYADVGSFGEVACVGSIDRHEGAFWGTLVWPGLSLEETPTLQVPLTFEQRKLDDTRPPSRILLRDAEGWTGPARRRRQERLRTATGFAQRHVLAVELAAIALFEGEGAEAQRGAYTQYATDPATPAERELWQITVAMIDRGWLTEANAVETDATEAESSEDPVRPPPNATDVLQDAGDGQKAQKEEASDAR